MTLSQSLDEVLPQENDCMLCERTFFALEGQETCADCARNADLGNAFIRLARTA